MIGSLVELPPLLFRGIGGPEIAIILVVLVLIFGASRLPKLGASLGQGLRAFKGAVTGQDDSNIEEPKGRDVKSAVKNSEEGR
jgi:sec-independent protein translocase protein TatA